jgi:hypothetical protein
MEYMLAYETSIWLIKVKIVKFEFELGAHINLRSLNRCFFWGLTINKNVWGCNLYLYMEWDQLQGTAGHVG